MTIDWDALRTELGVALLDYGLHLCTSDTRRWACDCKIIPIVLGGESEPLDVHGTGWEIIVKPSHVEFIPPAILDPLRRPLRNPLRC